MRLMSAARIDGERRVLCMRPSIGSYALSIPNVIDCARCGTANPEGSHFCNSCGASLVSRVGVQERRIVTALFADLARSTSLGEKLDPEVVRGLVGEFFELATREIEARG